MGRRQPRQNGIRLERAVIDQSQSSVKGAPCGFVSLVPGCEGRDHYAGARCCQRLTRSSVSRTCSAVRTGSSISGIATSPFPRFFSCIRVGAISISRRPSPARISSDWPGFRPRACRNGFGTTIRSAASMVDFMAYKMAPQWHQYKQFLSLEWGFTAVRNSSLFPIPSTTSGTANTSFFATEVLLAEESRRCDHLRFLIQDSRLIDIVRGPTTLTVHDKSAAS